MISKFIQALCLAALMVPLGNGYANPTEDELVVNHVRLAAAMEEMSTELDGLRASIDQTRFDAEEWLENLEYDAQLIVDGVTQEVNFEAYDGVLRGITGTLQARAGNSADQSLLLAFLLKNAGFSARIVRGELSVADTSKLISSMVPTIRNESLGYLDDEIRARFGEAAASPPSRLDWHNTKVAKRTSRAAEILLNTLADHGIPLTTRDVTDDLVQSSRGYFWVQYREGPSAPWIESHPAFGAEQPPTVRASEYFSATLPEKYQHRLVVSAWLTQRQDKKVKTHRLMSDYERPIANLDGKSISFRNHPNGTSVENLGNIAQVMDDTTFLLPTLNNAVAPGAMAFDVKGRVVDPFAMQSAAADLFSTLGDKLESATSTIKNPGDPQALFVLESMWLEFTFISPGGAARTTRRYLVPPNSGDISDPRSLLWDLTTDFTYVVNAGHQSAEYLADRYLASGSAASEYYTALVHKFTNPNGKTTLPKTEVPVEFGPLAQFRFMDENPLAKSEHHTYRSQPNIVGTRRGFRDAQTIFVGVDVIANNLSHLSVSKNAVHHDTQAALMRGVWDTSVESISTRISKNKPTKRANAVQILIDAVDQKIDLQLITPNDLASLDDIQLTSAAKDIVRQELAHGYAIVVPRQQPIGPSMSGWWRINTHTGETLGMTADGYGSEVAEYIVDMFFTIRSLGQAVQSFADCEPLPSMSQRLCCAMEAHMNNVAGHSFGSLIGGVVTGKVATAGSAIFTIVDEQTRAATEQSVGEENATGLMPTVNLRCEQLPDSDF